MTITLNNPLLKGSLTAKSTWKELVLNSADLWRFGFFLVGSKWHLLTTVAAQHDPYCHLLLVMNSGCGKYYNVGQAKKVKQAQDFNQLQFMVHRWWSPELWLILTFHLAPSSGRNSNLSSIFVYDQIPTFLSASTILCVYCKWQHAKLPADHNDDHLDK